MAAHLALLAAVLWGLEHFARVRPPDPDRLVFVEPAPPPPPAGALEDVHPAPLEEAEPEVERLAEVAHTAAPTATRRITPTARPTRRSTRVPTAARAAAPPVEVPPRPAQGGAGGAAGGATGGTAGGVEGGQTGGVIGGRGDEVVSAETAAKPPVLIDRVLPEYPVEARARKIEGQVLLRAIVDRNGRIEENVVVLRSVPQLDEAAIAALRQWRFTPGRDRDGNAVRVRIDVPMRFQLR